MAIEQNGIFSDWKVLISHKGAGFISPASLAPLLDNEEKLPVSFALKPYCCDISSVIQMKAYPGTDLKPGTIRICIHLGVGVETNTWG